MSSVTATEAEDFPAGQAEALERLELRCANGPLLGVLILSTLKLEVKRGRHIYEVDLAETLRAKEAVVLERSE